MNRSSCISGCRRLLCLAAFLLVAFGLAPRPAFAQQTDVLAMSGDPAPDGNGIILTFFAGPDVNGPVLNDAGQTVFPLYLTGTSGGEDDETGLYFHDGENLVQLARGDQPSPDGNGTFNRFTNLALPALNNGGVVSFTTSITGTNFAYFAPTLFSVHPGSGDLSIFAQAGDPSPDRNGAIQYIEDPYLTESGGVSFTGTLTDLDPIGKVGAFRGSLASGGLELIARQDEKAPNGNGFYSGVSALGMNNSGQMILSATIRNSTTTEYDYGVYRIEPDGTFTKILRLGDTAPDGGGVFVNGRTSITPNASGQVAVSAYLAPAIDQPTAGQEIYLFDGTLSPMVRTGDDTPGGGTFDAFGYSPPGINDSSQIVFTADVDRGGQQGFGIYRVDAQGIVEILYKAGAAPDGASNSLDIPVMNQQGQVAVYSVVNGEEGIYFFDDDVGLLQVARKGMALAGSTISEFRFTGSLNNLGQIAYEFELANGHSGLALWSFEDTEFMFRNGFE